MNLRDATIEDIQAVAANSISGGIKEYPASADYISALEHEGKVIGVGGVKMLNPTVAWVWFDLTPEARTHMIAVYRIIRDWMQKIVAAYDIERLMAAVDSGFPEGILTAEHLGFTRESVLKRFFGDRDGYMYVYFPPEKGVE